jgi:hypothetical protein
MRFTRGDLRDHIDPSEIDHGTFVAALNTEAAAEKSKNQLLRDF